MLKKILLAACVFSLSCSPASYASLATSSDLEPDEELFEDGDLINDLEVGNDGILKRILDEIVVIRDSLSSPELATSSDAEISSLDDSEMDSDGSEAVAFVPDDAAALALPVTKDSYVNAVRFDAAIDGEPVVLLFPPESIDSLYIDQRHRLWNMSSSTVQGRIVDDVFNPYATSGKLVYLTPCLGNNFSSVRSNGSPNYIRRYYWYNDRLTYTDTYTEIVVDSHVYPFFVSDTLKYIGLFLLGGGVLFLWLKSFKRY